MSQTFSGRTVSETTHRSGAEGAGKSALSRLPTLAPILWLLAITLLGGLVYIPNRHGAFLADDYIFLNQLTFTHTGFFDNLSWFGRDWGIGVQFYRPWVRLAYYFQFKLFSDNAYGWHLFSALLHVLNSWLVFAIGWRVGRGLLAGGIAGLVFALHPVHTEPVSWISGQTDLWATLFACVALLAWILFRQEKTVKRWYIVALVAFLFGLFSKESVATLPLVLLAYDFVTAGISRLRHEAEPAPGNLLRLVGQHAPFWGLLGLYLILRLVLFKGMGGYTPDAGQQPDLNLFIKSNLNWLAQPFGLGGTSGLIIIGLVFSFLALSIIQEKEIHFFKLGLSPYDIPPTNPSPDEELDDPAGAPAPSPAVAEPEPVVIPPVPYHNLRLAGFGFILSGLLLLPAALTPPAERFTYLPSVGFSLFLGAAITYFHIPLNAGAKSWRERFGVVFELGLWLRIGALIALCGIYLVTTTNRVQTWVDAGNSARKVLSLTKTVIPSVRNYDRFISSGVPDTNSGALIFRTGYRDAIQLLYHNQTLDAETSGKFPITTERLRNTIFLTYLDDRLINHTEIQQTLIERNDVRKQEKAFLKWDFTQQVPSQVSGSWVDPFSNTVLARKEGTGMTVQVIKPTTIQSPEFNLPAVQLGNISITMTAPNKGRAFRGEISWVVGNNGPEKPAISTAYFDINADGETHTYKITPDVSGIFTYGDQIARIKFVLPDGLEEVTIQNIEQSQLPVEYRAQTR